MSGRSLHWLDVFTSTPFAGNPLAVIPDADGLSGEQMQAVARELGLSETTFVLGGAERLRIFSPTMEVPLAGHPVVGATLCLAHIGRIGQGRHVFVTGAGDTPVDVDGDVATMTQGPRERRRQARRARAAAGGRPGSAGAGRRAADLAQPRRVAPPARRSGVSSPGGSGRPRSRRCG